MCSSAWKLNNKNKCVCYVLNSLLVPVFIYALCRVSRASCSAVKILHSRTLECNKPAVRQNVRRPSTSQSLSFNSVDPPSLARSSSNVFLRIFRLGSTVNSEHLKSTLSVEPASVQITPTGGTLFLAAQAASRQVTEPLWDLVSWLSPGRDRPCASSFHTAQLGRAPVADPVDLLGFFHARVSRMHVL